MGALVLLSILAPAAVLARSANIINGFDASPGEFPWQASLQRTDGFHFCGASIISDRWLVTASHCLRGKTASEVKVVTGLHDLRQRVGNPKEYGIARIIMHPGYDSLNKPVDITLLQTKTPIQMDSATSTVALPTQGQTFDGQTCQISGWGKLGKNKGSPDILQKLDVEVKSKEWCEWRVWAGDSCKVCIVPADGRQSSACSGDSGGPLVCDGTLVGAASYVFGDCQTLMPNVYADVANAREWIRYNSGL